MRTCVIFNPAARGEKAQRLRRHLDEIGAAAVLRATRQAGEARALAAQAVSEGFEVIVAAGGDGTLNEVLNGIGDVPGGFTRARLGVLPLGTVNVFAKELGLPIQVQRAWDVIQHGHETLIDLPRVEFTAAGKPTRRYFAELAGAGLDARAVELVELGLKRRIGLFAYVAATVRALREPQPQITLTVGDQTATGELVVIGNGRYYGGRFRVFPDADLRDGRLGIVVFPRADWATVLRCSVAAFTGRLHRLKTARYFRAATFQLQSANAVRLEVDGELAGSLPASFSVQPQALRVSTCPSAASPRTSSARSPSVDMRRSRIR